MQRLALITVTKAHKTTPLKLLCVAAGVLPIDILLEQSTPRYYIRIGKNAVINDVEIECREEDAVDQIRSQAVN